MTTNYTKLELQKTYLKSYTLFLLAACVFLAAARTECPAQPLINLEFIAPSIAFSYPSIGLEVKVLQVRDTNSFLSTAKLATSIGPSILNAQFVPVECRFSFLRNRIDLIAGMNIQSSLRARDTLWNLPELSSSKVNPTVGIALRLQKDSGGFLARLGIGAMYHIGDRRFYYSPIISLGFSLDD